MTHGEEPQLGIEQPAARADVVSVVRAVRRLTIAIWCLIALLALAYIAPWATYLLRFRQSSPLPRSAPSEAASSAWPSAPDFDNDFHARPPEEKIKRATVILVTTLQPDAGKHKEVIREIVKRAPGVRFYYKVGDEFGVLSHTPTRDCNGCEGDGQVVFLIGNPAEMASSYSYVDERIQGMGGLSLQELRELARRAQATKK